MPADAGPKSDAPIKASGDAKRVDSALAAAAQSSELAKRLEVLLQYMKRDINKLILLYYYYNLRVLKLVQDVGSLIPEKVMIIRSHNVGSR